MTKILGKTK